MTSLNVLLGLPKEFRLLPDWAQQQLGANGRIVELKRGEVLTPYGHQSAPAFVVRNGLLTVNCYGRLDRMVVTDFLHVHEMFFTGVSFDEPSIYEVRAVRSSSVMTCPSDVFRKILRASPDFSAWAVERQVRKQMAQHLHRARLAAMRNMYERIMYVLWNLAEPQSDGSRTLRHKIPQETIGSFLNASRPEVNRNMRDLEDTGYITRTDEGLLLSHESLALFNEVGNLGSTWADPGAPATA